LGKKEKFRSPERSPVEETRGKAYQEDLLREKVALPSIPKYNESVSLWRTHRELALQLRYSRIDHQKRDELRKN